MSYHDDFVDELDFYKAKETEMNRMIKLFQQRSDQAYEKYLLNRANTAADPRITLNDEPWHAAVLEGAKLFERFRIWGKAAELLRKEELNK
jgi:hypothetical protein